MEKVIMIFGSTTGMTEMAGDEVIKAIKTVGEIDVEKKNVIDAKIEDLTNHTYIIFGCSTWDYGSLQYDFEPFHEEMKNFDFSGKKVAIFGCGDKAYGDTYCLALKTIKNTVEEKGGRIIIENMDISGDLSDENIERIHEWGKNLGSKILNL